MTLATEKVKTEKPIQIATWAEAGPGGMLYVPSGPRALPMRSSDATGTPLVAENKFGADILRFGPNEGVPNHIHVGAHILFVIKGNGYVTYDGVPHRLEPGLCYFVPGMVEHAIKAESELILIVVGNDHRPVDSMERMEPVDPEVC